MGTLTPDDRVSEGEHGCWSFWCPACNEAHVVNGGWSFNGNRIAPTFHPSIAVSTNDPTGIALCHSMVTDGNISYCPDCTHAFAGKTLPLAPWKESR